MSGQPLIYAKDAAMYRQHYMDTLNLTSNINDMNLKANQTYKATGQVPPQSSMPDNRTTSEKLADIEKLKVSLIADLKPLMGPQMAQSVIQGVSESPYNTDGALFTFFAQRAPDITKSAMVSYKYGIKGDLTDIRKFVTIVENMYSSAKSITDTAKKFFNTNTGSNYTGATGDEINRMVAAYRTIIQDLHRRVAFPSTEPIGPLVKEVERRIIAFTNFIDDGAAIGHRVTISSLGRLSNQIVEMQNAGQPVPADTITTIHRYLSYVDTFPRIDNIMTFLNKIQNIIGIDELAQETLNQRRYVPRSTDNRANIPMITSILQDLISILPPANDITEMSTGIVDAIGSLHPAGWEPPADWVIRDTARAVADDTTSAAVARTLTRPSQISDAARGVVANATSDTLSRRYQISDAARGVVANAISPPRSRIQTGHIAAEEGTGLGVYHRKKRMTGRGISQKQLKAIAKWW
jgi:hypothetical protein